MRHYGEEHFKRDPAALGRAEKRRAEFLSGSTTEQSDSRGTRTSADRVSPKSKRRRKEGRPRGRPESTARKPLRSKSLRLPEGYVRYGGGDIEPGTRVLVDCDGELFRATVVRTRVVVASSGVKIEVLIRYDGNRGPARSYLPSDVVRGVSVDGVPDVARERRPSKEEGSRGGRRRPKFRIGTRVRKSFPDGDGGGGRLFSGRVTAYDGPAGLYRVRYEDGDEEEMEEDELEEFVVESAERETTRKSNEPTAGTRKARHSSPSEEESKGSTNSAVPKGVRPSRPPPRLPASKPSGPDHAIPPKRPAPPKYRNGTVVWKPFLDGAGGERVFSGRVASYDSAAGLYLVRYDDGDREEMAEYELDEFVEVSSLRVAAR